MIAKLPRSTEGGQIVFLKRDNMSCDFKASNVEESMGRRKTMRRPSTLPSSRGGGGGEEEEEEEDVVVEEEADEEEEEYEHKG